MTALANIDPKAVIAAASDPTEAVLALLGQARTWLAEVQSIEDAYEFMAKAEALRSYTAQAKLGREAENAACEIRVRAERRIGELLGPAIPGQRSDLEPSTAVEGSLDHNERHAFRKLAAIPAPEFDEHVEHAKETGRLSRSALLNAAKRIAEAKREDAEDREWERGVASKLDSDRGAIRTRRQRILGALLSVDDALTALLAWPIDDVIDAVTICGCGRCADCSDPLRHIQQKAAATFEKCLAGLAFLHERKAVA